MAVTDGPGNGLWTRDETILALDLYLKAGKVPDSKDPRVIELSEYLRALPLHPPEKRKGSFRNPDGVAFKIGNLRAVQTGTGLKNVSKIDKEVWAELGTHPDQTSALAAQIRQASALISTLAKSTPEQAPEEANELVQLVEGGITVVLHRRLERKPQVRELLLKARKKSGQLKCDACGLVAAITDPRIEAAAFEAHHVKPLSQSGVTSTTVDDMALLCATCHRLIHRSMVVRKRWIPVPQFQALINPVSTSPVAQAE